MGLMTKRQNLRPGIHDYFGLCPVCLDYDGCANAGKTHVFYCKDHKTSWVAGSNLFSSWRDETVEEQRQKWDEIGLEHFGNVEPAFLPTAHQSSASSKE